MGAGPLTAQRKRFAIVSAVYNVAAYLDDFIRSIDEQSFPHDQLEVVMVDDGSTDDCLSRLNDWAAARPGVVTVLHQSNGGQASARNHGLTRATAEWVTFIDPDDMVEPGYLDAVHRLIDRFPGVPLVAANRWYLEEATGELRDGHPLRSMFADGDKKVELDRFPQYFWHHVGAGFFRLDDIRRLDLTFDTRVWPTFEDAHFSVRYQLGTSQSMILAASARYLYRRRADNSSTLQTSDQRPEKFTNVPRYGYLDVLERAREQLGFVPEWLQNLMLYELSWYLSAENRAAGSRTAAQGEVGAEFVRLVTEVRRYLDSEVIESFRVRPLSRLTRDLLLHAFSGPRWHSPYVRLDRYDRRHQDVRLVYRYVGEPPTEAVLLRGLPATGVRATTRELWYFGQVLMRERIIWMPANGTLRVQLNGVSMPLVRRDPEPQPTYLRPAAARKVLGVSPATPAKDRLRKRRASAAERQAKRLKRQAGRRWIQRRFDGAWVLHDRIHQAGDNAERLFEHLRSHRRDVNAWFVVEPGTPDWRRLKSGPLGDRVIAHGSREWKLLMIHCAHLISSHIDADVVAPSAIRPLRSFDWKFTFLQHGVIKDDMSRWLNEKWMTNLFITSTAPEYASIAGDGPYVFTPKEVQLTGLPRHDRLLSLAQRTPEERRDLILVAPTWRHYLNAPALPGTQRRALVENFQDSEYARTWGAFLNAPDLFEYAERQGLTIGFLPHPNLAPALSEIPLPAAVLRLSYDDQDVQQLLARTRVMVTDYSSLAFEAAYLVRPVVYLQFDADRMLLGDHLYRPGYFDYREHGFGPVEAAVPDAIEQVRRAVEDEPAFEHYLDRARRTFPFRDGRACERVVAAIEAL